MLVSYAVTVNCAPTPSNEEVERIRVIVFPTILYAGASEARVIVVAVIPLVTPERWSVTEDTV